MFFTIKRRAIFFFFLIMLFTLGIAVRLFFPSSLPTFMTAGRGSPVYVLDAGHGGPDGGAVSSGGVKESDVNLAVTRRLDALLRFLGYDTLLTRTEDVSIHSEQADTLREMKVSDLKNRVALVNGTPDAVLVSIHQNSLPSVPSVHGAQVFYNEVGSSALLAYSIQSALNDSVNSGNEKQEKKIGRSIYLMKNVTCPAVLVECGFMSNKEEAAKLQTPDHQRALAAAIAAGLLNTEDAS